MQSLALALIITEPKLAEEVRKIVADLPIRIVMELPRVTQWEQFLETLERNRADVVVTELAGMGEQWEERVRRIRQSNGSPSIVVLHPEADPQLILRVMRAGAGDYLTPPIDEGIKAALARIAEARPGYSGDGNSLGKTIAFLSAKGGCGATTAACHTAVGLQKQSGKRVLLADFDLANGTVGFVMKSKSPYSVADAMANIGRMDLNYWNALVSNGLPGLEVVKAPPVAPGRRHLEPDRLHSVLRFARQHYDWIVTDLGRGLGTLAMSALTEVDETYLMTTLDVPALHQAKQIGRALRESGYRSERIRLVLNRVPRRTDVTAAEVEKLLEMPVTATLPEDYEALYESYADGKLLAQDSQLGRKFRELAGKICGVTEPKRKRTGLFG
jgi:pilus assembly protein CpaE